MAFVSFPEPTDLALPYESTITDGKPLNFNRWTVENPHPGFGKDPNILNEFGHTKFPMFINSKITGNKEVVFNEMELAQHSGEEYKAPVNTGWTNAPKPALREDGPTLAEYIAAGYKANTYPPVGYASKATDEELTAAIEAENAAPKGWGS